jgi:allantoinase
MTYGSRSAAITSTTFTNLYEEGAETGMVMCIALHPYCICQPFRVRYLDELLAHITSHVGVWNATGKEVKEQYNANVPE